MKKLLLLPLFVFPFATMQSQVQSNAAFQMWPGAELQKMEKTLAADAAANANRTATIQIADYPNDLLMIAHREADGQAELHETQVDVFVIQSGSATLLVGGVLQGAKTTAPHEQRGGTIVNGAKVKLGQGDLVRIPANTPHQLLLDGSKEFTYLVVKVKGY